MHNEFSKYDVYAVAGSLYCYPDSRVLRNKFNVRDSEALRRIEADISAARQSEMLAEPIKGRFTANHLCSIHRRLLGDVYTFAGKYRREDIAKGDTRFVAAKDIEAKLKKLLSELANEKLLSGMDEGTLIKRAAYYMAELNYIHPFREGNGRAIREFMRLIFLHNGYEVNWAAVDVEKLLQAMIDSVYDTGHLEWVLGQCVNKI